SRLRHAQPHRRGQEPRHGRGRDVLRPARRGAEARAGVEAAVVIPAKVILSARPREGHPATLASRGPRKRGPRATGCSPWLPAISAFTRVFDALCAGTTPT